MKRIILALIITINLTILPHSSADVNDGLVAYWPFNGNANDESGNGNHGTVIGAILTEDRFGNADSAYSFDGVNDLISIPDKPIFTLGTKPFTVALWVKLKRIKGRDPFIGHDEGSGERNKWIFWYDARGHDKPRGPALRFHINSPSLRPTDTVYHPWNPTVSEWYHVAVTRYNNSYSLFINGKNVATDNDDNIIPDPNFPLTIGKAEGYYLNGLIDDVRIYNRALPDSEISELYNEFIKDLGYTPVTPCRIVDTRKTTAGIIDANKERDFRVSGPVADQGGNLAGCPSTAGAPYAVHINMIAVDPTGKGNLQAFPVGAGPGAGLSVNYNTIDTNLANAGTVKIVSWAGADITVASNFSSAHTVIDVLGYYYPDAGFYYTPVDPCRIVDTRKTTAGIIDANKELDFRVSGPVADQGGNPAGCPSTLGVSPEAAHLNMVAVNPTGKGNLQAFPAGAGVGAGLSVNYNTIDTNLADAGTVKTSPDITVASNFSSAHTVIDVLGYYSDEEDLLYTPVTPCRIVDTRKTSAGIISANTQRDFRVFGAVGGQGGDSDGCPSPGGAPHAVHINMIAVNPTGKGNLQAFPVGAGTGAGLSVNYNTIDTNLANAGTVKTVIGAGADITVASNFSSAHAVVDVLGYYYPAP